MEKNPYAAIQELYPSFPKVPKKIADYILEDPNRILDLGIHQMAQNLDVAESSIVRFCKLIGFSGFSDAKMMLAKCSASHAPSIFTKLGTQDSAEQITRNVFDRNIESLQKAVERLDFSCVQRAADLIGAAGHVVVCGVGSSASMADNVAVHLMRIGLPAVSVTDSELLQVTARLADSSTVFLAITKTGNNLPIVNAFRVAKEQGAKTICLTCYRRTPMDPYCDVSVVHYIPSEALVSIRVIQNTIIDSIIICATIHRQDEVVKTLEENRHVVACLRV